MNSQPHVLYVEDEPKSRRVMKILLVSRMELPHVTIFEDSYDFMERVEALNPPPEIIFLDIHVPPHNGFEMLSMLRKSEKFQDTTIIALTASVMNEEIQKLRESGFNGCIAKPLDSDTFEDTFQALVQGKELWQILS